MDAEQIKKRQTIKVILTEALMVFSVIIMVAVLMMIATGYWINQDFEVERQGLLQLYSVPGDAEVRIDDGESVLHTYLSKMFSSGEHKISITKEGYDSWEKNITMSDGLIYRLSYPRLFPAERKTETVLPFDNVLGVTVSPDRNSMLVINNTTDWQLLKLNRDEVSAKTLDVRAVMPGVKPAQGNTSDIFAGDVRQIAWARDNARVLLNVYFDEHSEWIILNTREIDKSINLSKLFKLDFDRLVFSENDSDNLLALADTNLYKIDLSERSISTKLLENVKYFSQYNNLIGYVTRVDDQPAQIGYIKDNGEDQVLYKESDAEKIYVAACRFYEEEYVVFIEDDVMTLQRGRMPRNEEEVKMLITIFEKQLGFVPTLVKYGADGRFVYAQDESQVASLDMEAEKIVNFSIENAEVRWLDNSMFYVVDNGDMIVYDFDGLNRRVITHDVSNRLDATITDDKWIYYFTDNKLMRENLVVK